MIHFRIGKSDFQALKTSLKLKIPFLDKIHNSKMMLVAKFSLFLSTATNSSLLEFLLAFYTLGVLVNVIQWMKKMLLWVQFHTYRQPASWSLQSTHKLPVTTSLKKSVNVHLWDCVPIGIVESLYTRFYLLKVTFFDGKLFKRISKNYIDRKHFNRCFSNYQCYSKILFTVIR